jgi:predicted CXXCH cytochrome family protein
MKIFLIIIFAVTAISFAQNTKDECYNCHEGVGDKPTELYLNDVHYKKGISCNACHGGDKTSDDMDIAMDPKKGFIGIPKGDKISELCISCHSDETVMKNFNSSLPVNQMKSLTASVHGKTSIGGNERMMQCITCHDSHGIKSINNPSSPVHSLNIPKTCSRCHSNAVYMRAYNPSLPVDQYVKYKTSAHGELNSKGNAKTADCADCHGSHDIRSASDVKSKTYPVNLPQTCSDCHSDKNYMSGTKLATDQFEKYERSVHGIALLKKNDPGSPACNDCHGNHAASPPGVESISKVCGTCHALNAELFANSLHKTAFDKKGFPECETCHGHHEIITATEKLIGVNEKSVCVECHKDPNDKGYQSALVMRSLIDSLNTEHDLALEAVHKAKQKGMEISEAEYRLRDVVQAKYETRTLIHSLDSAKFNESVGRGLDIAAGINLEAKEAVEEYFFRRVGLGASVLMISFLAFALFLYIRKIEKK